MDGVRQDLAINLPWPARCSLCVLLAARTVHTRSLPIKHPTSTTRNAALTVTTWLMAASSGLSVRAGPMSRAPQLVGGELLGDLLTRLLSTEADGARHLVAISADGAGGCASRRPDIVPASWLWLSARRRDVPRRPRRFASVAVGPNGPGPAETTAVVKCRVRFMRLIEPLSPWMDTSADRRVWLLRVLLQRAAGRNALLVSSPTPPLLAARRLAFALAFCAALRLLGPSLAMPPPPRRGARRGATTLVVVVVVALPRASRQGAQPQQLSCHVHLTLHG